MAYTKKLINSDNLKGINIKPNNTILKPLVQRSEFQILYINDYVGLSQLQDCTKENVRGYDKCFVLMKQEDLTLTKILVSFHIYMENVKGEVKVQLSLSYPSSIGHSCSSNRRST